METYVTNIPDVDRMNSGINTIDNLSTVILIVGLVLAVIAFFTMGFQRIPENSYSGDKEIIFIWGGIITSLLIGFTSILSFAVCKVLATIAKALVQIVDNTKKPVD